MMAKVLKYVCLFAISVSLRSVAQIVSATGELDPSREIHLDQTTAKHHRPLPEEYIWTAKDAAVLSEKTVALIRKQETKIEPHYFRSVFQVSQVPKQATLYIAGPRSARVFLNGKPAADLHCEGGHHFVFRTMSASIQQLLRPGRNVVAIEVVRGWGSHHHTNSLKTLWLNSGEILAAKIVPASRGVDAPALAISNQTWKSSLHAETGWESADFDDKSWPKVQSLGSIEGDIDFFQWNADTGLYSWPGYQGEAPYLANYRMPPVKVDKVEDLQGAMQHEDRLLRYSELNAEPFSVELGKTDGSAGLLLDFGREVEGRLVMESGSTQPIVLTLQYGESIGELETDPFLGVNPVDIPSKGQAQGPKSAFRYALLRFPQGSGTARFRNIYLDGIYYPVRYSGSFLSSDQRLNRIWEIGAYTAHLCMQDSIWDGIKRDRGRWIGDMDVIDRVIADVFSDKRLMGDALGELLGPDPVTDHINGLPGYSAWWIVAEAEYYRRYGDLVQLHSVQKRLLQLLSLMDRELDARKVYVAASGKKPFVDWAKDFDGDSPEARRAIHFEYLFAYRQAAWMLHWLGDEEDAELWNSQAAQMTVAAQKYLFDADSQSFGDRWQTNALAILSGAANADQQESIWSKVLSRTIRERHSDDVVTPYYGYYVLAAMARAGHKREALQWIRAYWGGMVDEGATSFWEAYDPRWPKDDPHAHLEADGKVGYNASLAHGWSAGPTAWLMEEILGVQALEPGFRKIQIRPELGGLAWVKGAVPTPRGLVRVGVDTSGRITVDLPSGIEADVLLPAKAGQKHVTENARSVAAVQAEKGTRLRINLQHMGHFVFAIP